MSTCSTRERTSGRGVGRRRRHRLAARPRLVLIAALVCGIGALGPAAANTPLPPTPPEPAPAAERQEGSALGSYLVGRFALARGDYAAAAAHMQRTLSEDPDNPSLLRRTVTLLIADGRIEDAARLARRLVVMDRSARLAPLVLALQDARDDHFDAALRLVGEIRQDGIYSLLVPLAKGWLHTGSGSDAAALASLAPLAERDGYRSYYLFHAGLMHDLAGRQEEAEALLREAVALSGGSHRPVAALGGLLARTGRMDEARAVYEDYRAQNPGSVWVERVLAVAGAGAPPPLVSDAREGLAEALLGTAAALPYRENGDGGLIYARLALFLRDDLHTARFLIGELLDEANRLEAAVAAYRSIPAGSDFDWAGRLRAASALVDLEREDEAVAALGAMTDERPERSDAATALGDAFRMSDRFEEAATAYDTAIERLGSIEARHWRLFYVRGIAFERMGAWSRAEADFLHALELEPDQPLVLNYLGYSWVEQRHNLDEARIMIEKAVALRPNDGYIVDSLGWAAYRLGDFEEAVVQLERAVELEAGDPIINDHLGDAYWQVGRLNEARFQWRRVLTLEPEDELAGQVRRKIAGGLSAGAEADDEDR